MVADVSTVNNVRCNFDNTLFTPGCRAQAAGKISKQYSTHKYFDHELWNWNSEGTGAVYFHDTFITSICTRPGLCSTDDPIVGTKVTERSRASMVDLDVDWQYASEIWGLAVLIPGVLEAKFQPASVQRVLARSAATVSRGFNFDLMGRYKSKLFNVTWMDSRFAKFFNNSKNLSISFTMDMYNLYLREARISGTIGLTSDDDPVEEIATRGFFGSSSGFSPFFVHYGPRILAVDLSVAITSDKDGVFHIAEELGELDLGVLLHSSGRSAGHGDFVLATGEILRPLTTGGTLSTLMPEGNAWYETYGGVLEIDISPLDVTTLKLMKNNRMCIFHTRTGLPFIRELEKGVNFGLFGKVTKRADPGDQLRYAVFASFYGKPARNIHVDLDVVSPSSASVDCHSQLCNRTLASPINALKIFPDCEKKRTDYFGMIDYTINVTGDPENPRGCGLDGQIYPLKIEMKFQSSSQPHIFLNGGFQNWEGIRTPFDGENVVKTTPMALHVYSDVPYKVCPTWHDVQDIFITYSNLYPVMKRHGIVDLHSYDDIRRRIKHMKSAMFDTDISDPRYMPVSRDLSKGKKRLIWNWLKCGMKKQPDVENAEHIGFKDLCRLENLREEIAELTRLLQSAITAQMRIIPPYFNAYLSLNTEFGRNRKIANTLDYMIKRKMLNLSIFANLLNSIEGEVILTSIKYLPNYPGRLDFGLNYDILPGLYLQLEPMSNGLANEVFTAIEETPDPTTIKEITRLALLLQSDGRGNESRHAALFWKNIHDLSSSLTVNLSGRTVDKLWKLHAMILYKFINVESCARSTSDSSTGEFRTIFTGDIFHQVNQSDWSGSGLNGSEGEFGSNENITVVKDLQTAVEAINIILANRPHTSFFSAKPWSTNGSGNRKTLQGRERNGSHRTACSWHENTNNITQTHHDCGFVGRRMRLFSDGVWPIVRNPTVNTYAKESQQQRLNHQFNLIYTRFLHCLQVAFRGRPDNMKECLGLMNDMKIAGKKFVKMPIQDSKGEDSQGKPPLYCAPSWTYIREVTDRAGLPTM